MYSLVKIYGNELQAGQSEAFSYTVKGYEKIKAAMVCGKGEVSMVFDKDNTLIANSVDLDCDLDTEPNKRFLKVEREIKGDFIIGNVQKTQSQGTISIYLLIQ